MQLGICIIQLKFYGAGGHMLNNCCGKVFQRCISVCLGKVRLTWRLAEFLKTFSHVPQKGQRADQSLELILIAEPSHDLASWSGFCCARWIWGSNPFSFLLIALSAQVCFLGLLLVGSREELSFSLLWGISIQFSFNLLLPVNLVREA